MVDVGGGVGVPTWTLLSVWGNLRHPANRDAAPWYPDMRLFRQRRWGEWETVMADVVQALSELRPTTQRSGLRNRPQRGA